MNLIAELKRRNVIRMAGLYLVGAWLIAQVAETILPAFEVPNWVLRAIIIVLALGFVPAVIFAWVFELTPGGLKRDEEVDPATSIAPQTARRMDRMLLLVSVLALGYFAFDKFAMAPQRDAALVASTLQVAKSEIQGRAPTDNRASIAVLPFVNMSTDAENGFFADGISEELLNVLAGVKGLKVASRTSAFSFKGKDTPIPEIARQLGVEHVLEGSVRKQGTRVRITAQLIHAGSDGHLWSETYDRDLDDIFKVQEEIAQAITGELQGLLGKQQVAVAASTSNLEAYQSFLRGRARFHQRNDLEAAISDLSNAVERDPAFAEAWLYLAAAWRVAPGYSEDAAFGPAKARAGARAALARAEALSPKHPMVLAIRASFLEDAGDYTGTLALLEEAANTGLQDSTSLGWHGQFLLRAGYVDEAIAVLEAARELDPLVGVNNGHLAIAYLSAGQYAKAEATALQSFSQGWGPGILVVIYDLAARGEHRHAVALWDKIQPPRPPPAEFARLVAAARELLRDPANASALATLRASDRDTNGEFSIALQRFDRLFDEAERVQALKREDREEHWWIRSAWLPSTRGIRENPRFFALAQDLGMLRLWEARGYPPGCRRLDAADGTRLDCGGARP